MRFRAASTVPRDTDDELAGIVAATELDGLDERLRRVEFDQLGARRQARDNALLAFWIGVTVGLWLAVTIRAGLRAVQSAAAGLHPPALSTEGPDRDL